MHRRARDPIYTDPRQRIFLRRRRPVARLRLWAARAGYSPTHLDALMLGVCAAAIVAVLMIGGAR